MNTITVGGFAYAQTIAELHRITLREMGQREQAIHMHTPENRSFDSVVLACSAAWSVLFRVENVQGSIYGNLVILMSYCIYGPAKIGCPDGVGGGAQNSTSMSKSVMQSKLKPSGIFSFSRFSLYLRNVRVIKK